MWSSKAAGADIGLPKLLAPAPTVLNGLFLPTQNGGKSVPNDGLPERSRDCSQITDSRQRNGSVRPTGIWLGSIERPGDNFPESLDSGFVVGGGAGVFFIRLICTTTGLAKARLRVVLARLNRSDPPEVLADFLGKLGQRFARYGLACSHHASQILHVGEARIVCDFGPTLARNELGRQISQAVDVLTRTIAAILKQVAEIGFIERPFWTLQHGPTHGAQYREPSSGCSRASLPTGKMTS